MGDSIGNINLLSRLLDVASLRHRVIAHNVANVNTPGFHRLEVSFEGELERAMAQGRSEDVSHAAAKVVEGAGGTERMDGNNVDIDVEMGQLNKNTLLYRTYSQVLSVKLNALRSAITGR